MTILTWLKQQKELLAAATPGKWEMAIVESVENWFKIYDENMDEIFSGLTWSNMNGPIAIQQNKDFQFISEVRTEHERALKIIEKYREALESLDGMFLEDHDKVEQALAYFPEDEK